MGLLRAVDDTAATVVDICVVGAGPHGLAFLTHFLSPSEHLDDRFDEHPNNATLFQKSRTDTRIKCKVKKSNPRDSTKALRSMRSGREVYEHFVARASATAGSAATENHGGLKLLHQGRICVMDKFGGEFLRKWNTHFEALDIPCLRSTTHQHPDPLDLNLLASFAYHTKRHGELIPLKLGTSDQERDEAFQGPYLRPSRTVFKDFIRGLVKGFHLDGAVNTADVSKLQAIMHDDGRISGFHIAYNNGGDGIERVVIAMRVILAMGHANLLSIPHWASDSLHTAPRGRLLHYEELIRSLAMAETTDVGSHMNSLLGCEGSLKGKRILIVGGGQTSVHLAQLAVSKLGSQPGDVTFLTRSALRSQPFDISLQWLSTRRYESMASFWSQDHAQRARTLRGAKGGGCQGSGASVDGECVAWLRASGIDVKEQCEVVSASWSEDSWSVELWDDLKGTEEQLGCDLIWLATGNAMNFLKEPVIASLQASLQTHGMHIQTQGNLPVLNEDLSLRLSGCTPQLWNDNVGPEKGFNWNDNVGVHVMGAYAALELGPGALNLMGARAGACRISRSIRQL